MPLVKKIKQLIDMGKLTIIHSPSLTAMFSQSVYFRPLHNRIMDGIVLSRAAEDTVDNAVALAPGVVVFITTSCVILVGSSR